MNNDDETILIIIGTLALAMFGPALLARFVPEVRNVLLEWHIVVDEDVVIPIADGAGFDLARILVVAAVTLFVVFLIIVLVRRSIRVRREQKSAS